MKRTIYIFALAILAISTVVGQRLITIPAGADDIIYTSIKADSTARTAALPTQTIYLLQRNQEYRLVSPIENYAGFFLHIKAEAGTGYKPFLIAKENAANAAAQKFNFRFDGKLEDLTIEQRTLNGTISNRGINVYNGASLWVKGCEVMHDRGALFVFLSDNCSIYIEDCFLHSSGHPKSLGGNGRIVDLRGTAAADSVVVVNTTMFNLTDRIVRNISNTVNYLSFDHCTFLTSQGYHGGLQAGKVKEMRITNNIFNNQIAYGSASRRVSGLVTPNISEQTHPEKSLMYVVTVDTSYLISGRSIVVKNNNVWWDQQYKDLWVKWKDSTSAPGIFTPTMNKLMDDSTKAYFVEPLSFSAPPASILSFVDSAIGYPTATVLPENWCNSYQEADGLSPINASYGTSAQSYTKGGAGYPVGDLNWYPTRKAAWNSAGRPTTDVPNTGGLQPYEFTIEQNYPNPFNPATMINFSLSAQSEVTLKVVDLLGREVAVLVNRSLPAGPHTATWDAGKLASGLYLCQLKAGSNFKSIKMLLTK